MTIHAALKQLAEAAAEEAELAKLKNELALTLARRWPNLTEEKARELNDLIRSWKKPSLIG